MPVLIDRFLVLALLIAFPLFDHFVLWPWLQRRAEQGARLTMYGGVIALEWALALPLAFGRVLPNGQAAAAGLTLPGPIASVVTLVLLGAIAWLFAKQRAAIAALDDARRARAIAREGAVDVLIPRGKRERGVYAMVALSAGVCEEFVYRGYLPAMLTPLLGLWGAAVVSLAGFVVAHTYQGRAKLVNVAILGGVFAAIAMLTHSLLPGMVLHAAVDLVGGESGAALHAPAPARLAA